MTTHLTQEAPSNFTVNPTEVAQHVSAIVPVSCIAIALTVFASLGYAYYKDLYVPQNDANIVETADFDFHSDNTGRRSSVMFAQMILFRVRHGFQTACHFMGDAILSAGSSLQNKATLWWEKKTRKDYERNTFYMGVHQWSYQRDADVLI